MGRLMTPDQIVERHPGFGSREKLLELLRRNQRLAALCKRKTGTGRSAAVLIDEEALLGGLVDSTRQTVRATAMHAELRRLARKHGAVR